MTGPGVVAFEIPVISGIIGDAVKDAAGAVLDAVVGFLFGMVAGGVEHITITLIAAMEKHSTVTLREDFGGLADIRATVLAMSLALMLGLFFLNVIKAMTSGDPGPVIRAALVDLPAAIALTTLFVAVAAIILEITDKASEAVLGDVGANIGDMAAVFGAGSTVSNAAGIPGAGGLLMLVFAVVYIFAAMMVWFELLIRSALIYIIVVMAPLGYATRASPGTRQMARRTTEILLAVIISKFGIALAFSVGGKVMGDAAAGVAEGEFDFNGMFIGTTVMLLASFMPWMLLKAIPVMEAAAVSQGAERSPMRTATAVMATAATTSYLSKTMASGAGGASSAAGGTQAAAAGSGGGVAAAAQAPGAATSDSSSSSGTDRGRDRGSGGVRVVPVGAPAPGIVGVAPAPPSPGPAGSGGPLGGSR